MAEQTYTAAQVARAATELREAAGAEEEAFSAEQVVQMLGDEVRLLRERGMSNERIADLMTGFDIQVSAEQLEQWSGDPLAE